MTTDPSVNWTCTFCSVWFKFDEKTCLLLLSTVSARYPWYVLEAMFITEMVGFRIPPDLMTGANVIESSFICSAMHA